MIEVDYGGGGHRTRLRDPRDQLLLCLEVPPCPRIKRSKGEGAAGQGRARQGGVLLPPGVGLPPFLVQLGEGKEGKEKEKEGGGGKGGKGGRPLVQFGLG